ncbi:MAG: hypothetical protein Tsb0020_33130 [Haliangiales bacterium]
MGPDTDPDTDPDIDTDGANANIDTGTDAGDKADNDADNDAGADADIHVSAARAAEPRRIDRGDIFWIEPDEGRGSVPGYAHPHVVVQEDVFNHSRVTTVIVCALTSNLRRASEPGNVLLEVGEGGLSRQSVVIVSQISSVAKARLGARIGSLSSARVTQIVDGLRFQQRSFFRR